MEAKWQPLVKQEVKEEPHPPPLCTTSLTSIVTMVTERVIDMFDPSLERSKNI